jgi:hypothetical protein
MLPKVAASSVPNFLLFEVGTESEFLAMSKKILLQEELAPKKYLKEM